MVKDTKKQTSTKRKTKPKIKDSGSAFKYLESIKELDNKDIDILEAALALAVIFLPGVSVDKYRNQVKKLEKEVKELFKSKLSKKSVEDSIDLRLEVLIEVVYKNNEFRGDKKDFENVDNINFIRLLETRTGIPVSMGILLMHLANKMKWQCEGINFPGHFLLRMDFGSERVIIDPFEAGKKMEASDLRELIKTIIGNNAELSALYYEPVEKRDILLRLQNNLKARLIEAGEYDKAVLAVESIESFYPDEYRLYLDKGVLYAKLQNMTKSIDALEKYISLTPDPTEKQQASILLEQIKITML